MTRKLLKQLQAEKVKDLEKICDYHRLLLLGPEVFLKVRDKGCPHQKRFLFGVLYPTLLGVPENVILISPLPSCQILSFYGSRWTLIYSSHLHYYVQYLSSCLQIKAYQVSDPYDLSLKFTEVLRDLEEGALFLLLPDPVYLDPRGRKFLHAVFQKHSISGLDLLGLKDIPLKKFRTSEAEWAEEVKRVLQESSLPGKKAFLSP